MAEFNDTTVNGNLNVTEDIQIGYMSVTEKLEEIIDSHSNIINNPLLLADDTNKIFFEPTNGTSYNNYGKCYYYKVNTTVHLHLGMQATLQYGTIYTLPSGYRPKSSIGVVGLGGSLTANAQSYVEVQSDGDIVAYAGTHNYILADIVFEAYS